MTRKSRKQTEHSDNAAQPAPLPLKEQLKQHTLDHYDLEEIFRVHANTIRNWCNTGILSYSKVGRKRYYDAREVEELLKKRKQTMRPGEEKKKK